MLHLLTEMLVLSARRRSLHKCGRLKQEMYDVDGAIECALKQQMIRAITMDNHNLSFRLHSTHQFHME